MEAQNGDYTRHSPDKLLVGFTQGRMVLWVVVAILVHVVFTIVTSLGSIRDRWIDPEGAAARKAAIEAARKAALAPAPVKTNAPSAKGTNAVATAAATNAPAATNATPPAAGTEAIPDDRRNTPVVNRITEAAKPEEIPRQPGDLGISIDDTNTR